MPAYASMLEHLFYAQNLARIIHQGLILALYIMILNKYTSPKMLRLFIQF